jgi:1-acyl-sn-glycerol-3-phosphate acyltransferase
VFLRRSETASSVQAIAAAAHELGRRTALLLFPEGGNWTPARRHRAIDHLRRGGAGRRAQLAEHLEHLLPPRPAGVFACLEARPDLQLVFVAHTGLEELVSVSQVWARLPFELPMSVRWWKAGPRPPGGDRNAGQQWLDTEWAIIDEWIGTQADRGQRMPPVTGQGTAG